MVSLRQDSKGNYIARKRLPDDVREDYGQLYGARFEAKFFARASVGKQVAQQKFHLWASEVERRIQAIRKAQRGEGMDLDREQAAALAGEWYRWQKDADDDLMKRSKSPAAQARQRLAAWVRKIGVNDAHLSPNHAWRHTFKHIGRRFEPNDTFLDYICGHAPATVGRAYGAPELKDLARVIERFPRYKV
ncbi:MAG: hypothetical protein WBG18_20595 [Xanthobacteraceae bacterium]